VIFTGLLNTLIGSARGLEKIESQEGITFSICRRREERQNLVGVRVLRSSRRENTKCRGEDSAEAHKSENPLRIR
jgi:hypothetical protein